MVTDWSVTWNGPLVLVLPHRDRGDAWDHTNPPHSD